MGPILYIDDIATRRETIDYTSLDFTSEWLREWKRITYNQKKKSLVCNKAANLRSSYETFFFFRWQIAISTEV